MGDASCRPMHGRKKETSGLSSNKRGNILAEYKKRKRKTSVGMNGHGRLTADSKHETTQGGYRLE